MGVTKIGIKLTEKKERQGTVGLFKTMEQIVVTIKRVTDISIKSLTNVRHRK